MKIGIIGGGATGTVVLQQLAQALVRDARGVSEILLFDRSGFDGGLAYRTPSEHHLLNMQIGTMSALAEDAGHFVAWLRRAGHDCIGTEHLPRHLYRRYLDDVRDQAVSHCELAGIRVRLIEGDVARLRCVGPRELRLETRTGLRFTLGAAVLCTGHNAPEDHYGLTPHRSFVTDPYTSSNFPDAPGIRIGIIGTGLSAIDSAIALSHELRHAEILCLSRGGQFPKVQPMRPVATDTAFRNVVQRHLRQRDRIAADALARCIEAALAQIPRLRVTLGPTGDAPDGLAQLEQDVEEAENGVANSYSYLATITDLVCDAWRRMEAGERSRFMRESYSGWMRHRHAMPLLNARKLLAAARSGRLRLAGGLCGVTAAGEGFAAHCTDGASHPVDFVISAAGPSYGVGRSRLYAEMARSNAVRVDPFGGIACAYPDGRVLDGAGRPHRNLYAVGSPTRGSFFYAAAMDINVTRARAMTAALVDGLVRGPLVLPTSQSTRHPLGVEG